MSKVLRRWKRPLIRSKFFSGLAKYPRYIADILKYRRMTGAEPIMFRDTYPILFDRTAKTKIDAHYFYQGVWAYKKIHSQNPEVHVDVGSNVTFIGLLTAITPVQFVDIRPLDVSQLANFENVSGSILDLPYDDNSIKSLSCLHVAEHIGLGRYGDPLDPLGTKKAAAELTRCLAPGGNLYFSVPVGKPRICFNAHRIHAPNQIIEYFNGLKLAELSGADDKKNFSENIDLQDLENSEYACGMFHFTKE